MNRSTFWMIKYMNGSVFSKARYMNGAGFEILAHTPVPKLPLSYPPEYHIFWVSGKYFSYFSMKTYVVGIHYKHLTEVHICCGVSLQAPH